MGNTMNARSLLILVCAALQAVPAMAQPNTKEETKVKPAPAEKPGPEEKRKLRGIDCERGIACPIISRPPSPQPPVTPVGK